MIITMMITMIIIMMIINGDGHGWLGSPTSATAVAAFQSWRGRFLLQPTFCLFVYLLFFCLLACIFLLIASLTLVKIVSHLLLFCLSASRLLSFHISINFSYLWLRYKDFDVTLLVVVFVVFFSFFFLDINLSGDDKSRCRYQSKHGG